MADDSGIESPSMPPTGSHSQETRSPAGGGAVAPIAIVVAVTWLASKLYRASSGSFMPLGLTVVGLIALIILWKLPPWQVKQVRGLEPKERFDRVNEPHKTLATILGGVALLAGFFGTWQNLQVAQEI